MSVFASVAVALPGGHGNAGLGAFGLWPTMERGAALSTGLNINGTGGCGVQVANNSSQQILQLLTDTAHVGARTTSAPAGLQDAASSSSLQAINNSLSGLQANNNLTASDCGCPPLSQNQTILQLLQVSSGSASAQGEAGPASVARAATPTPAMLQTTNQSLTSGSAVNVSCACPIVQNSTSILQQANVAGAERLPEADGPTPSLSSMATPQPTLLSTNSSLSTGLQISSSLLSPYFVARTLLLNNSTLEPQLFPATTGMSPQAIAYDPGKGEMFVANEYTNNVSVLSGDTDRVVASVNVGTDPYAVAYDPATDTVWVANLVSDNVSVISDATNQVIATVSVGTFPAAVAYDNRTDQVFVANWLSNSVTVISDATDQVVATVPVGSAPQGLAYDWVNAEMFVANAWSNTVSVVSDKMDQVVATVSVGSNPFAIAYDPEACEVFVANFFDANVSVIAPGSNQVVATMPVGTGPAGMAFDAATGEMLVTNYFSANVTTLSGRTNGEMGSVPAGFTPRGIAYDSGNGQVFVTDFHPGTVTILEYGFPVLFWSSGLPSTVTWWLNMTGQFPLCSVGPSGGLSTLSGSSIRTALPNGTYTYTVATPNASWGAPGGTLVVNGSGAKVPVAFERFYPTTFAQWGLPSGTPWFVNVSGGASYRSATGTVSFLQTNGSYVYSVSSADPQYVAAGGAYTVNGSAEVRTVWFQQLQYGVVFLTEGLPFGAEWFVNISGQPSASSFSAALPPAMVDGSYTFTVATTYPGYSAAGGSFTVAGTSQSIAIDFSPVTVAPSATPDPTFTGESTTLSAGASGGSGTYTSVSWSGSVPTGCTLPTGATNTSFACVPGRQSQGSYTITVQVTDSNGYVATGSVTLTVLPVPVPQLTFHESGLPAGTLSKYGWTVELNGTVKRSSSASINFTIANGTYPSLILGPFGYGVRESGVRTVAGPAQVAVPFLSAKIFTLMFIESGLGKAQPWCISVDGYPLCSKTTSLTYLLPAGTYNYSVVSPTVGQTITATLGHRVLPVEGSISLTMGVAVGVRFVYAFPVTFVATGPSAGALWSVKLGAAVETSTASAVTFYESNGTYAYKIVLPGGSVTPSSGRVVVSGAGWKVPVASYAVTFTELGLPVGTNWSVKVGSSTETTNATTLVFFEGNGTYAYKIGKEPGFSSSGSPRLAKASGGPVNVTVSFARKLTSTKLDSGTTALNGTVGMLPLLLAAPAVVPASRGRGGRSRSHVGSASAGFPTHAMTTTDRAAARHAAPELGTRKAESTSHGATVRGARPDRARLPTVVPRTYRGPNTLRPPAPAPFVGRSLSLASGNRVRRPVAGVSQRRAPLRARQANRNRRCRGPQGHGLRATEP